MVTETPATESLESRVAKLEGALPFLGTKEDIGELRNEIGVLRNELHDAIGSLRNEMLSEIGTLRNEMHSEIGTLRSEMHSEIGTLRSEMHSHNGSLRADVGELRGELKSLRWITTLGLTLLGVVMGVLMFVLN